MRITQGCFSFLPDLTDDQTKVEQTHKRHAERLLWRWRLRAVREALA